MGQTYADVQDALEADLAAIGLTLNTVQVEQPVFPENVQDLPERRVKELYDHYLCYYEFLTDQLIFREIGLGIAQENKKYVEAVELLNVTKAMGKSSQDLRDAAVLKSDAYQEASHHLAYLQGFTKGVGEKRSVVSKIMDRLYRELLLRGDVGNAYGRAAHLPPSQGRPDGPARAPDGPPKRPWEKRG